MKIVVEGQVDEEVYSDQAGQIVATQGAVDSGLEKLFAHAMVRRSVPAICSWRRRNQTRSKLHVSLEDQSRARIVHFA